MKIVEYVRSLTFGGLLTSGMAGLLFLLLPSLFPKSVTLDGLILVSGLLGAGFHRLIEALLVQTVFHPLSSIIGFYRKQIELRLIRKHISDDLYRKLSDEIAIKYFLGETYSSEKLLFSTKGREKMTIASDN